MPALNVFIDTNIFLSFFAYTKDDVEQLKIISQLADSEKLTLYIPEQVVREFARNRDKKIFESTKEFVGAGKVVGVPRHMLSYKEAALYATAFKDFQKAKNNLLNMVKEDVENRKLAADETFSDLIDKSKIIYTTPEILSAAQIRKVIGDPPGKNDSHGDQINWEALISGVPDESDLHIVSKDGDFSSPLNPKRPHDILINEWRCKKKGELILHEELRPFINSHFPGVNLATDVERNNAVESLENTGSFSGTHAAVAKLEYLFETLTWSDADRILGAFEKNNQVAWVANDEDVMGFYCRLIDKFRGSIDDERLSNLRETFPDYIA